MVEILATVAVLAVLIAVAIPSLGSNKATAARTKLLSDVNVLNRAVGLYVAEGGNLDDAQTYQQVIDRLKTKATAESARRHVGPVTGRLVDPRLAARDLSPAEASSGAPRATWDAAQKKFVVSTQGSGIGSFYFDDSKAGVAATEESRQRSNMQFNRTDGWIWEWGGNPEATPLVPSEYLGNGTGPTPPGPVVATTPSTTPPPSGGGTAPPVGAPVPLPTPTILPVGGMFTLTRFPSSIQITNNGASTEYSQLVYRTSTGSWTPYGSAFKVTPGTRVYAKNVSLDTARYLDSPEDTEIYLQLVTLFTAVVTPQWTNMMGKENLVKTISNLNVNDIKASYGKPAGQNESSNELGFKRVTAISVPPDKEFRVGEIRYFNGTVSAGTEATSIDLKLNIQVLSPTLASGSATAHLSLWSSPNTSNEKTSADYAQLDNPTTDFTVTVDGVTYALELKFANVKPEEGWTDGTKLYVFENSYGHADLVGKFKSKF